jgi:hypothetical protein
MLFVSWATDAEMCSPRFTESKPLREDGIYQFVCDSEPAVVSQSKSVEINVYITPKAHWAVFTISADQARKGVEYRDEDGHFKVQMDFTMEERFSFKEGKHTCMCVTLLELQVFKQREFLEQFYQHENHKLVAQVKVKRRTDMMNVRTVYIGRAQVIETSRYGKCRKYVWKSADKEAPGFTGISFKTEEDLHDIERIQKHHMTSPRKPNLVYIHDCDGFSNPNLVLPVQFEVGEGVTVQVFNLKFDPPKFVEVHLRSAEFNAGEVSYEVVHDATLRFVFTYHVTDTKKIIIDTIIMKVQAYLAVLNNLGDSKSAKTV